MADTLCPTCGEPWDISEPVVRTIRRTHRCPCCPKDMPTDAKLENKLKSMLFDDDMDDEDPMSWL